MTEDSQFRREEVVDLDSEPGQAADPATASAAEETPEGHAVPSGQPDDQSGGGDSAPRLDPDARVAELTADLQRVQAEFLNYKRRVERDRELVLQNSKYSILSSLLPVLDAIDRAREHGDLEGGLKAIAESLEKIVEGQGLHKFGAPGDEFDPARHEALMHGHSPDVTTSTCQTIVQAGYSIGERVVRPALVTVVDPEPADGPPEAATPGAEPGGTGETQSTEAPADPAPEHADEQPAKQD